MNPNKKFTPVVAQKKTGVPVQSIKRPVAPPVYRPQPLPKVLQTKRSLGLSTKAFQSPHAPVAPPVYRPQQSPKAAQPKMTNGPPSRKPPVTPSVYRPQALPRVMQTKMPGQPVPERKQAPLVRQASAAASTPWQPNASRNSIQRYLEDVDPDTYWRTIDSTRSDTVAVRDKATRKHWEKAGIEGGPRARVDQENTVMSSAVVEYFVEGRPRQIRTDVHVSGNPWTDFDDRKKYYRDLKEDGPDDARDCAEPKVLKDVDGALHKVRQENGRRTIVYLYSEFTPCFACEGKIKRWMDRHKNVELVIVADQLFAFGEYWSRWRHHYDRIEGHLCLGFQVRDGHEDKRYVAPAVSKRAVSDDFTFARAAGGGGGGDGGGDDGGAAAPLVPPALPPAPTLPPAPASPPAPVVGGWGRGAAAAAAVATPVVGGGGRGGAAFGRGRGRGGKT